MYSVGSCSRLLSVCTCESDLRKAEQAENAVIELQLSTMTLVHRLQDTHQFNASLGWVAAFHLMGTELVVGPLPWAANPLVLTLCKSVYVKVRHKQESEKSQRQCYNGVVTKNVFVFQGGG